MAWPSLVVAAAREPPPNMIAHVGMYDRRRRRRRICVYIWGGAREKKGRKAGRWVELGQARLAGRPAGRNCPARSSDRGFEKLPWLCVYICV